MNHSHSNIAGYFWIPYNTPSLKNGKRWVGTGLISSDLVIRWKRRVKLFWKNQAESFISLTKDLPLPLYIELTFVRKPYVNTGKVQEFDYINMAQIVADEMKSFNWIVDDSVKYILPYFGEYVVDTKSPGVMILVLKTKPNIYIQK